MKSVPKEIKSLQSKFLITGKGEWGFYACNICRYYNNLTTYEC